MKNFPEKLLPNKRFSFSANKNKQELIEGLTAEAEEVHEETKTNYTKITCYEKEIADMKRQLKTQTETLDVMREEKRIIEV